MTLDFILLSKSWESTHDRESHKSHSILISVAALKSRVFGADWSNRWLTSILKYSSQWKTIGLFSQNTPFLNSYRMWLTSLINWFKLSFYAPDLTKHIFFFRNLWLKPMRHQQCSFAELQLNTKSLEHFSCLTVILKIRKEKTYLPNFNKWRGLAHSRWKCDKKKYATRCKGSVSTTGCLQKPVGTFVLSFDVVGKFLRTSGCNLLCSCSEFVNDAGREKHRLFSIPKWAYLKFEIYIPMGKKGLTILGSETQP